MPPVSPKLRPLLAAALAVALLASAAWAFHRSLSDVRAYPGNDLRNRLVGARAALGGLDPYYFRWQPALGDRLLVPNRPVAGPAGTTVTPFVLLTYLPFAPLSHATVRVLHFATEWAALLVAIALLYATVPVGPNRPLFLLAAATFVCSPSWRLHLERGQYYVFLLALVAVGSFAARRATRPAGWSAAASWAAAVLSRPVAVALPALQWALGRRRAAAATTVAVLLGLALTLPVMGPGSWRQFAISAHDVGIGDTFPAYYLSLDAPTRFPTHAEGIDFTRFLFTPGACVTLTRQVALHAPDAWIEAMGPARFVETLNRIGLGLGLLLWLGWAALARRLASRGAPTDLGDALLALAFVDADYFAPIRWGYVDIVQLAPLALLLPRLATRRNGALALLVAVGLVVDLVFANYDSSLGRNVLVVVPLNLVLLSEARRATAPTPAPLPRAATAEPAPPA